MDAAETEAPGLRDLARRFLEAEAGHLGVPLDEASILARRAGGVPEVDVTRRPTNSSGTWRSSRIPLAAGALSWRSLALVHRR
jgi:hypothetical protein